RWEVAGHHTPSAAVCEVSTMPDPTSRASQLELALADLLARAHESEATAADSLYVMPMPSPVAANMDRDIVSWIRDGLVTVSERAFQAPDFRRPAPAQGEPRGAYPPVTSHSRWPSYPAPDSPPNGKGSLEAPAWS